MAANSSIWQCTCFQLKAGAEKAMAASHIEGIILQFKDAAEDAAPQRETEIAEIEQLSAAKILALWRPKGKFMRVAGWPFGADGPEVSSYLRKNTDPELLLKFGGELLDCHSTLCSDFCDETLELSKRLAAEFGERFEVEFHMHPRHWNSWAEIIVRPVKPGPNPTPAAICGALCGLVAGFLAHQA